MDESPRDGNLLISLAAERGNTCRRGDDKVKTEMLGASMCLVFIILYFFFKLPCKKGVLSSLSSCSTLIGSFRGHT